MTDEELIARLREGATWDDDIAAADRIEKLIRKNDNLFELAQQEHSRAEQLVATNEALVKEMDFAMMTGHYLAKMECRDLVNDLEARIEQLVATNERLEAALHVANAKRLRRYDWQEWTAQDIEDAEGIVCAFLDLIQKGTVDDRA